MYLDAKYNLFLKIEQQLLKHIKMINLYVRNFKLNMK